MSRYLHILFLIATSIMVSQEIETKVLSQQPLEATAFYAADDYGALYYSRGNDLFKKDSSQEYQFTALQLGKISSVDILNPLKITVFYEGANTAVILDNTLSEIARINFSAIDEFRNVSHATTASDRRLWIFNTDLQQLEIFDWNSSKIITQFPPMPYNASSIVSNFNFCWVLNKDGLSEYNNYGSFLGKEPLPNDSIMAQTHGDLIAFAKAGLLYKPSSTKEFKPLNIQELTVKQLSLTNEILYIYDGEKVSSLSLKSSKK